MPSNNTAPISELSIALQFGARLPLTPNKAIELYAKFRGQCPRLELKQPIGALGGVSTPTLQLMTDDVDVRYWFSSEDEYFLIQVQPDLIAFNWRKRSSPGEEPATAYPGFENMVERHKKIVEQTLEILGVEQAPPVAVVNLFYDNIWEVDPKTQTIASFFRFWNKVGIPIAGGPEVRFTVPTEDESLGSEARIDVNGFFGGAMINEKLLPIGKLVLSAMANPKEGGDAQETLNKLHVHIHSLLKKLVVEDVRKNLK